jgi:four helix bundle protein
MNNYKELIVWKKSVDLAVFIYEETRNFPSTEIFGLTSQLRRASSSIFANIAEGAGRNSNKEFIHFLGIALGSMYEVETFMIIANKIGYIPEKKLEQANQTITEIDKMIRALQKSKT